MLDEMKFKCCKRFCRVKLGEFVPDCSSPATMLVEGGSWKTMLPCDGFAVRLSVVGSMDDADLTLGVEPTADV